jgi:hypothetical protein
MLMMDTACVRLCVCERHVCLNQHSDMTRMWPLLCFVMQRQSSVVCRPAMQRNAVYFVQAATV